MNRCILLLLPSPYHADTHVQFASRKHLSWMEMLKSGYSLFEHYEILDWRMQPMMTNNLHALISRLQALSLLDCSLVSPSEMCLWPFILTSFGMVLIELVWLSGLPLGLIGAFFLVAESFFGHSVKFQAHGNRCKKLFSKLKSVADRMSSMVFRSSKRTDEVISRTVPKRSDINSLELPNWPDRPDPHSIQTILH